MTYVIETPCLCCGRLHESAVESYCYRCTAMNDGKCPECGDHLQEDQRHGIAWCVNCGFSPVDEDEHKTVTGTTNLTLRP